MVGYAGTEVEQFGDSEQCSRLSPCRRHVPEDTGASEQSAQRIALSRDLQHLLRTRGRSLTFVLSFARTQRLLRCSGHHHFFHHFYHLFHHLVYHIEHHQLDDLYVLGPPLCSDGTHSLTLTPLCPAFSPSPAFSSLHPSSHLTASTTTTTTPRRAAVTTSSFSESTPPAQQSTVTVAGHDVTITSVVQGEAFPTQTKEPSVFSGAERLTVGLAMVAGVVGAVWLA